MQIKSWKDFENVPPKECNGCTCNDFSMYCVRPGQVIKWKCPFHGEQIISNLHPPTLYSFNKIIRYHTFIGL